MSTSHETWLNINGIVKDDLSPMYNSVFVDRQLTTAQSKYHLVYSKKVRPNKAEGQQTYKRN
jgi:hypothetical protein